MSAICSPPLELNNEMAGPGKQGRVSGRSARLPEEPGLLSNRIATPTASRILAVRMNAKGREEVAVGNFAQMCEQKVSGARLPKPCFAFAYLLKDLGLSQ